ncbi:hypothetical protein H4R19_002273 [Coemansia spiralis]|nr:hypothetical protein H4R19_002273 [Coemansia spiralis]
MADNKDRSVPPVLQPSHDGAQLATFGAGCLWGVQLVFQRREGVLETQAGFTGGREGVIARAEAVRVEYDPGVVTYSELLDTFWTAHDPTQGNRQGIDIGERYRSAIFYHDDEQKSLAEASKTERQKRHDEPITTEIAPAGEFQPAIEFHQRYLEKGGQSSAKGCTDTIACYGI